jgi:hypothetical protein
MGVTGPIEEYDSCPLYMHTAIEFSEAARLILGAKAIPHSKLVRAGGLCCVIATC